MYNFGYLGSTEEEINASFEEQMDRFRRWVARGVSQDDINHAIGLTRSIGCTSFEVTSCKGYHEDILCSVPSLWDAIIEWDRHYRGCEKVGHHFYVYAVYHDGRRECVGDFTAKQPVVTLWCDEVVEVMQTWDAYSVHRQVFQQLVPVEDLPVSPLACL